MRLNWTWMILDISPHNRIASDFSIFPKGLCWSAPLEIFKSIHSRQYLSDWVETWDDNTRHQSAQSLWAGFFKGEGSEFPNFKYFKILDLTFSRQSRERNHEPDVRVWRGSESQVQQSDGSTLHWGLQLASIVSLNRQQNSGTYGLETKKFSEIFERHPMEFMYS